MAPPSQRVESPGGAGLAFPPEDVARSALVLGSGGARGAYEVGVARFLFEDLPAQLGHPVHVDVLCGTSAGALNALGLAAYADQPSLGVAFLTHRWLGLQLRKMLRPRQIELLRLSRLLMGCPPRPLPRAAQRGNLLDSRPFERLISRSPRLHDVPRLIRSGVLDALCVSATEIATGHTTVFYERSRRVPAPLGGPGMVFREADRLGPEHARASAAIPFLFRPVNIDGRLYCDGALRQSVPLSPALHLGADRLVVVSTQHHADTPPAIARDRETAAGSPVYLLGKTANALTQDRIDDDLQRLDTINELLAAGEEAFGHDFVTRLNQALARRAAQHAASPRQVHPVRSVFVRPSESLGKLAAEYVRSRTFHTRNRGTVGRVFAQLGEWDSHQEADLLSYFLFDGHFAESLMRLGRADAQKQAAALAALFDGSGPRTSSAVALS